MTTDGANRYPAVGEVIDGKYRIDRMLGEGGMGAVAGATHLLRKAQVALKFISPDVVRVPGVVERFMNEAVAASAIDSDHVVRIFDVGKLSSGLPFIVMEMMSGCDLEELLAHEGHGGGLPPPRAVHFVLQILRALQVAHGAGIIHRDLKPSNAFVITKDGEEDFVKLLDFGISKIQEDAGEKSQSLTQTNTGLGTPLYMSPEQARSARDVNARSDLYSVGAILYELLAGRTPYLAETPNDLLFKLFTAEPDPLTTTAPSVSPELAAVVHQALSKDASARPASAYDFAELLAPFADHRSTGILARIRAAQGAAGRGSSVAFASTPPPAVGARAVTGVEQTALQGAPVTPATAGAKTGGTQLTLEAEGGAIASKTSPKRGATMPIVLGVVAIGAVAGAFVALRPSPSAAPSTSRTEPSAPAAASSTSAAETSAAPIVSASPPPEIAPVIASAAPSASAAPTKKAPPPGGPPPANPGGGKKNPFNVGIVQ